MAVLVASANPPHNGLRPLDERRDLSAVADLVEICFSDAMEPEGRRYIRELRLNARTAGFWQVVGGFPEARLTPYAGFVWEEGGKVVGNVSLFPFQALGNSCYLIANVAVHPGFRERGIGRALTSAGINYARSHRAHAVWLHVRMDNDPAVHIYQALGFIERAQRTTWQVRGEATSSSLSPTDGLMVVPRTAAQWSLQKEWLRRLYPRELSWHLPVYWKAFEPGLSGLLYRLVNFSFPRHWAVQRDEKLLGLLTWQRTLGFNDNLWLATPEEGDMPAIRELLMFSRRRIPRHRIARLNSPTSLASGALLESGFKIGNTLLWMEYRLNT